MKIISLGFKTAIFQSRDRDRQTDRQSVRACVRACVCVCVRVCACVCDRVVGQLRGDKECPISGVTKSGRVWRKVPESDARSLCSGIYMQR